MTARKTTKQFILEAKKKHNDKYDYSKVEYINISTKVGIICPEHGEFWQTPSKHLNGHGCLKCCKTGIRYTTEEFKNKVDEIHNGEIYVANDAHYINSHTDIKMICPKHGEFWTKPNYILTNHGCPKCGIEKVKEKMSFTIEDFIKKAKNIHNDEYDYQLSEYNGYDTPIKIICHKVDKNRKEHGVFLQSPHSHLSGHGCPLCKMSNLERKIYCLLKENDIKFEYEKNFKWLGLQTLDFYLPDYSVAIECQGIQHFEPCNFGSTVKTPYEMFDYVRECDNRKHKLCNENGVKLLYYKQHKLPSWVTDKNNYFSNKERLIKSIMTNGKYENI